MPLFVIGNDRARFPRVDHDDYIPLDVDWITPGKVQPIYYRVKGNDSGDIEIKIEPLTGEIIGLVVIESPIRQIQVPATTRDVWRFQEGSVFVDRGPWEPNVDKVPTRNVVYEHDVLKWGEDEVFICFSWSELKPQRFFLSGSVGLGVTGSNTLACILAKKG